MKTIHPKCSLSSDDAWSAEYLRFFFSVSISSNIFFVKIKVTCSVSVVQGWVSIFFNPFFTNLLGLETYKGAAMPFAQIYGFTKLK